MGVELSGKIIARQIPMAKSGTDATYAAPLQKWVTPRRTGLKSFTLIVSITYAATTVLAV
jgi:hypothetical protein